MVEFMKAFAKAQAEFPEIKKDKEGQEGHRKYKYANLHSILKAVTPVLSKHGFALIQVLDKGETPDSLILRTELWHESGEKVSSTLPMPDPLAMKAKEFGGVITYFRRYAIAPILGIEADEDLDANTEMPSDKQKGTSQKTSGTKGTQGTPQPKNHAPSPHEILWKKMEKKGWTKDDATKVCNAMFGKKFLGLEAGELKILDMAVESKTAEQLLGEK